MKKLVLLAVLLLCGCDGVRSANTKDEMIVAATILYKQCMADGKDIIQNAINHNYLVTDDDVKTQFGICQDHWDKQLEEINKVYGENKTQ